MEKALEFIEGQKKVNTVRSTTRDIRIIQDWLATEKFDLRNIQDIPPKELNEILTQFFVFISKKDGSQYQPCTLTNILYSIGRHLKSQRYTHNDEIVDFLHDKVFQDCRNALSSKKKQLKTLGMGNRPNRSVGIE